MTGRQLLAVALKIQANNPGMSLRAAKLRAAYLYHQIETPASTSDSPSGGNDSSPLPD